MSADGKWLVTFRYNGRIEGKTELTAETPAMRDRDIIADIVARLERSALAANGAIYIRGWSVDWIEAPLTEE